VQRVRLAFQEGHRAVLFVLPTGGGKTIVFSHIAEQAAQRGKRIAVLVHRVELLEQASRSLAALGVEHGLIAAGRSMNLRAPVQVASVQTLARRLAKLPADLFQLLIVDEAHHSNAGTWAAVIAHFKTARLLGVTATPVRSDGRGLGEFYSELVLGPSPAAPPPEAALPPPPPGDALESGLRQIPRITTLLELDGAYGRVNQLLAAGQITDACGERLWQAIAKRRKQLENAPAAAEVMP
jgi:hypothetical protein